MELLENSLLLIRRNARSGSVTAISNLVSSTTTETLMSPASVNLIALPTRLSST